MITTTKIVQRDAIFKQSVELAREEIPPENVWYNLNIGRMQLVISFFMDYIYYQNGLDFGRNGNLKSVYYN